MAGDMNPLETAGMGDCRVLGRPAIGMFTERRMGMGFKKDTIFVGGHVVDSSVFLGLQS